MTAQASPILAFDNTDPTSIYDYSQRLIGKSLHDLFGDKVLEHTRKGKGGMGQMVEELFSTILSIQNVKQISKQQSWN